MGFSAESIRRNPTADLGGGAFFVISDSVASAPDILFGLSGGGAALTDDSCKVFRSGYALNIACCATDREERFMSIVVLQMAFFSPDSVTLVEQPKES
jgi:hypothetical protein